MRYVLDIDYTDGSQESEVGAVRVEGIDALKQSIEELERREDVLKVQFFIDDGVDG